MRIEIHQIISNILDINKKLISTSMHQDYVIYPDSNKVLREIRTGKTMSFISVNSEAKIKDYDEIDKR